MNLDNWNPDRQQVFVGEYLMRHTYKSSNYEGYVFTSQSSGYNFVLSSMGKITKVSGSAD